MKGCAGDPSTELTDGDRKAIDEFAAFLKEKADKRAECGCHKICPIAPHGCDNPCKWPKCLTEEEAEKLAKYIES